MWNFDKIPDREGTSCIKYDLRYETFGRQDIIPMWIADMDFATPDFIIEALQKRLNHPALGYSFRPNEYYSSIIDWQQKRHNWEIEKEWICFTPGVVPAINMSTLAFTSTSDSIIIQPPVYHPFFSAVESHNRKLICNPLKETADGWKMDFDNLEESSEQGAKMIILSNPHNPIGRVWSESELKHLAEICLKHNMLILSDEIHCDLTFPGFKHTPMASLSSEIADITVTYISPSKTFNLAGLSTSSIIISNPSLREKFMGVFENLHLGLGNIFGTTASIAAYTKGSAWLDELTEYIKGNIEFVINFFSSHIPEIIPVKPEATYMIWLDCRKLKMTGKELNNFFVNEAGVGMNEGSMFGTGGEGFMRINIATSRNLLTKSLEQIRKSVSTLR